MKRPFVLLSWIMLAANAWAQEEAPVVAVAQPLVRDAAHFDFPARFEVEKMELRAPLTGKVQRVLVEAGAMVKAGDVLVEIDPGLARQRLAQAEALAQQLVVQQQEIAGKKAKAKPEDQAKLTAEHDLIGVLHQLAEADIERLRQELQQAKVRAPVAGRVDVLSVKPGQSVHAGTLLADTLATLVRTDPVRVRFDADQHYVIQARQFMRKADSPVREVTEIPVRLGLAGEEGFPHSGKVVFLERQADARTGRIQALAEFPNGDGRLSAELLADKKKSRGAQVRLTLGESRTIYLVVEQALLTGITGEKYLLLVDQASKVVIRPVTLGTPREGYQTIEKGLQASDWVVVGTEPAKAEKRQKLRPEDIVADIRLLRARPGQKVQAVQVAMPSPKP